MTPGQRRTLLLWVIGALLLALAIPIGLTTLAGRSGGSSGSSGGASDSPDVGYNDSAAGRSSEAQSAAPEAGKVAALPGSAAAPADSSVAAAALGTKIARTAWLGIEVADLTAASDQVRSITTAANGQILSESVVTAADPTGGGGANGRVSGPNYDRNKPDIAPVGIDQARLSVSIPAENLDPVLVEFARLGTVSYRSSQSQDVTSTYVDTKARITTMQAGVDSIRALLAKATSLDQVISIEAELTRRQADLDSLQAQLTSLDRRTTMSDVTLTLWTAGTTPLTPGDDNAFISSIKEAWSDFLSSVAVIVTGLAVLAPWLIIALVLLFPIRRLVRSRRTGAATPPAGSGPDPVPAGGGATTPGTD